MAEQKKGPSKPRGMSEHDWQEQLRSERRKPRVGRTSDHLVEMTFILTPRANRASAYAALETSTVLLAFARRYKYHEPRQLTTMSGRLKVLCPQSMVKRLVGELTPGMEG